MQTVYCKQCGRSSICFINNKQSCGHALTRNKNINYTSDGHTMLVGVFQWLFLIAMIVGIYLVAITR